MLHIFLFLLLNFTFINAMENDSGKIMRLRREIKYTQKNVYDSEYICKECGKSYSSQCSLIMHRKRHNQHKNYECKWCDKSFMTNYELKNHINCKHLKTKSYACDQCGKRFDTQSILTNHKRAIHLKARTALIKSDPCEQCNKTFSQKSALTRHIKQVHEKNFLPIPYSTFDIFDQQYFDTTSLLDNKEWIESI